MRYHVPFAHRHRGHRAPGPIYIGFDEPVSIQKRKPRFNWCGFTGILLALISPLTLFLVAPLALLLSLVGLRRAPRGMAVIGLILSLAATALLSVGIYTLAEKRVAEHRRYQAAVTARENAPKIEQTRAVMDDVCDEFRSFRKANDNELPNLSDGMMTTVKYEDAWEIPLRYGVTEFGCTIRSAGPDRQFDTADDLIAKVNGQPRDYSASEELLDDLNSE